MVTVHGLNTPSTLLVSACRVLMLKSSLPCVTTADDDDDEAVDVDANNEEEEEEEEGHVLEHEAPEDTDDEDDDDVDDDVIACLELQLALTVLDGAVCGVSVHGGVGGLVSLLFSFVYFPLATR